MNLTWKKLPPHGHSIFQILKTGIIFLLIATLSNESKTVLKKTIDTKFRGKKFVGKFVRIF